MPAQEKLSRNEQLLAYLAGIGIVIIVVALFLMAVGTASDNLTSSLLLVGVVVLLLAIAGWLYLLKPWRRFDDLKTPYFTGHEVHATPAAQPSAAALPEAEAMVEAAAPRGAEVVSAAPGIEAPVAEDFVEPAPPGEGEIALAAWPQPPVPLGETSVVVAEEPLPPASVVEPLPPVPVEEPLPPALANEIPAVAPEPLVPAPEPTPAVAPPGPSETRDDLTVIDGIGPRSQAALYDAGITTYAQVAATAPDALERAVRERNVRLVASADTWPLQAALAAKADWAALEALMTRIRGGVLHDDLTGIAGVGSQAQQALWSAGYRTLADVAAASPDALRAALMRSGVPDTPTDTWPEQAKQLLLHGAAE